MCLPALAAALPAWVAPTVSITSGVLGAASAIGQANYQSKVAQNNALSAKYAADDAMARGAVEEDRQRQRTRAMLANQRVAMGANGIDSTTGTGSQLLTDSAGLGEFDALMVRNNAMKQAYGYNVQSDNLLAEGRMAKKAGYGSAVGTLLTSGSKALGMLSKGR